MTGHSCFYLQLTGTHGQGDISVTHLRKCVQMAECIYRYDKCLTIFHMLVWMYDGDAVKYTSSLEGYRYERCFTVITLMDSAPSPTISHLIDKIAQWEND